MDNLFLIIYLMDGSDGDPFLITDKVTLGYIITTEHSDTAKLSWVHPRT